MQVKDAMTKDYISVDKNETLSKLLGKLLKRKQKDAIIVDGDKYVGVVEKRCMLNSRLQVNEIKMRHFIKNAHVVGKEEDLRKVCEEMVASDSNILPVVNENRKVEGVVFARDVISSLQSHAKGYKAKDIERTKLITLEPDTPVGKAINMLVHSNINHVPVTDSQGKLAGIIGTLDLLEKFFLFPMKRQHTKHMQGKMNSPEKQKSLMKLPISNEMTKSVEIVEEEEPLTKAVDIMIRKNLSDVVITRNGMPTGIITIKDVLRLFSVV